MRLFNITTELICNKVNIMQILVLTSCLSSCAVYSTGFNCDDSKGARCVMLSEVDRKVDSGEIEIVYFDKKCKTKICNKEVNNVPKKTLNQEYKVKIIDMEDNLSEYQECNNLCIK